MTHLEEQILNIVKSRNGIKAKDIARLLNMQKSDVNTILFRFQGRNICIQDPQYNWYAIGVANSARTANGNTQGLPVRKADEKLQNLCKYYLNCIALDDSNEVKFFQTGNFGVDYHEVFGVELEQICTEAGKQFIANAVGAQKSIFLGYPILIENITTSRNEAYRFVAPVLMFPIEYNAGNIVISSYPRINMEVMRIFGARDKNERLQELLDLEHELGIDDPNADFDIEDITMRLQEIRVGWTWKDTISPSQIEHEIQISTFTEDGIFNKAALVRCDKSQYTQGLETELNEISNRTEAEYEQSALYDWIHRDWNVPFESNEETEIDNSLLEVLPLNTEQREAIQKAMHSKLTIVTGPPGTGKSQVVTDLIVNLAWKSKSAVFSSKNNKAVDVVEQRVNNLDRIPVMQRLGGATGTSNLIDFFSNLLSIQSGSATDKQDYARLKVTYDDYVQRANSLNNQKNQLITDRNELDALESDFCQIRDIWGSSINQFKAANELSIHYLLNSYSDAWKDAQKENHSLLMRLFWAFYRTDKEKALSNSANSLNKTIIGLPFPQANTKFSKEEFNIYISKAEKAANEMTVTWKYAKALTKVSESDTLESLDKKLFEICKLRDGIAHQMWNKWLTSRNIVISGSLRDDLANFVASARMLDEGCDFLSDSNLKNTYNRIQKELKNILPITAVTSLSTHRRIPLTPGLFELLIIDEASQCDIASIIPLLFRAKRVMIIGDPKQLSHISTIVPKQDKMLTERYNIAPKWSYSVTSLYRLAESLVDPNDIIMLKDHHRCHGDIIGFSNEEFYNGTLRVATNYQRLQTPQSENPGIRWIDVSGLTYRPKTGSAVNKEEALEIIKELRRLSESGFAGSIGVVTPFRAQAETIQRLLEEDSNLYNTLLARNLFLADTVHKFQGDERDVMIFSTVISKGTKDGAISFLKNNGNLFNVAITRARAELIVVGDKSYCSKCGVTYMENFVKYNDSIRHKSPVADTFNNQEFGREYPMTNTSMPISDWEIVFYQALYDAGIHTIPQYSVDKYFLDLALFKNGKKLDIEVDGERYHKSWNGELCYRDQLRNQRLYELGWDVRRFWVYQLRDDMPYCINEIKKWLGVA